MRFIMSPPGKRRHNELNAAPPPETPRRTGKSGATADRDFVHSGESFCVRVKAVCPLSARRDSAFAFPSEGKVPEGRMRCRLRVAEPFTGEKVTLCFVTRFALHLISQLTLTAVSLRLGQAWLLTSPGGQFTTKPLLRSPQRGSQGGCSRQDV